MTENEIITTWLLLWAGYLTFMCLLAWIFDKQHPHADGTSFKQRPTS